MRELPGRADELETDIGAFAGRRPQSCATTVGDEEELSGELREHLWVRNPSRAGIVDSMGSWLGPVTYPQGASFIGIAALKNRKEEDIVDAGQFEWK